MPNSAASLPSCARLLRSAQRSDNSIDSRARFSPVTTPFTSYGVHSSKIITMSESSARWIRIDSSGPRNTLLPSTGEAKVHALLGDLAHRCASENTWKPPESVRIGPSQRDEPCRPPCASITSSARAQPQVEGVAEDDLRAERAVPRGVMPLTVP
jgi:hypothetical protein